MSAKLGFTLTLDDSSREVLWGYLQDNGSYTGLTGDVQFGRIDFGFAGFWTLPSYYLHIDFTREFIWDSYSFLVPVPPVSPFWMTYFYAFGLNIWLCFIGSIFVVILTMVVLRKLEAAPDDILESSSIGSLVVTIIGVMFNQCNERMLLIK